MECDQTPTPARFYAIFLVAAAMLLMPTNALANPPSTITAEERALLLTAFPPPKPRKPTEAEIIKSLVSRPCTGATLRDALEKLSSRLHAAHDDLSKHRCMTMTYRAAPRASSRGRCLTDFGYCVPEVRTLSLWDIPSSDCLSMRAEHGHESAEAKQRRSADLARHTARELRLVHALQRYAWVCLRALPAADILQPRSFIQRRVEQLFKQTNLLSARR